MKSATDSHSVELKSDGTVVAVGDNSDGQCNVGGWRDIVAVSAGGSLIVGFHTVGLKSDGTVVAVGSNRKGQCNVGDWRDIVSISAKDGCTVGFKADGTVVRSDGIPGEEYIKAWRIAKNRRVAGRHCPFYKWDENFCRPSNSDVGPSYRPHCQGETDWRVCDIYQKARQVQEALNEMLGSDSNKPEW